MNSRDQNKFLGIDLEDLKSQSLNEEEIKQLKFQVGKTPLKELPITRDLRLSYTQKPLYDASIQFGL